MLIATNESLALYHNNQNRTGLMYEDNIYVIFVLFHSPNDTGLPAVVVAVSAALNFHGYGTET